MESLLIEWEYLECAADLSKRIERTTQSYKIRSGFFSISTRSIISTFVIFGNKYPMKPFVSRPFVNTILERIECNSQS